jgi:hypothetical protein
MGGLVVAVVLLLPDGITGLIRKLFPGRQEKESRSIETHKSSLEGVG